MDEIVSPCPGTLTGASANVFLALISTLMYTQCSLKSPPIKDHSPSLHSGDEFDFIVVGAGSSGCVVANRLSKVCGWKVIVFEAGGDPTTNSEIPGLLLSIQGTTEDWQQFTEPQDFNCRGFIKNECHLPSGRVLGGSSSINDMTYVRGNKRDYDNWEKQGNTGWGWQDVLKYFKKSEDNLDFGDNTKYHAKKGYLKVGNYSYNNPIKEDISKAAEELGYPTLADINNGTYLGFGNAQGTVYQGTRLSAYKAFLYSVKNRTNLFVAKNAHVTKINIDPSTKIANGVEVKIGDRVIQIRAKKEVIVSAGALKTPQILMLSGIGPKHHLDDQKIPVIQDLSVGDNFQDHLMYMGFYVKLSNKKVPDPIEVIDELYDYFMHRKGILSTIGISSYIGFINTLNDSRYPDVQFHHAYYERNDSSLLTDEIVAHFVDEIRDAAAAANRESPILNIFATPLNPKSRGSVRLRSKDPFDKPLITPNYLIEEHDIETLLRAVQFLQDLMQTEAFAKYNPEIVDPQIPNCRGIPFLTEDYFRCSFANLATSVYHYCGTAKMGPASDPTAVVDPQLRVHGVKGLRVADASVMPYIVSGNINAPTIMIGEKAADAIKEHYSIPI